MDKPYIVDFGEGEERWQDPELGRKYLASVDEEEKKEQERKRYISNYQGLGRDFFLRQAKERYRAELIQRYLDNNPNTPTFEDVDEELASIYDERTRTHFNLNPKDELTSSQKNYATALRLASSLEMGDENEPFLVNLDTLYNRKTIEENKAWGATKAKTPVEAYKPIATQSTSPSRLQSLGVFGQKIDPNVPMFLQKANPHIPWGVKHPLRKAWNEKSNSLSPERRDYELQKMDEINSPQFLYGNLFHNNDITDQPWGHLEGLQKEVEKFGYTPSLIDKMQTLRQQELLQLESKTDE